MEIMDRSIKGLVGTMDHVFKEDGMDLIIPTVG